MAKNSSCALRLERRVLELLAKHVWLSEPTICIVLGLASSHSPTEDALFSLVQKKQVLWFGSSDRPLRYRILEAGQRRLLRRGKRRGNDA